MTFSITLGWWLAPLLVTIVSFAWALWPREDEKPTGGWFDLSFVPCLLRFLGALPASLVAWLVWSLLR